MKKLYNKADLTRDKSLDYQKRMMIRQFTEKMSDREHLFPCVPAMIGYSLDQLRYGFVGDPTEEDTIHELADLLRIYSERSREYGKYTSLIIFYDISEEMNKTHGIEQYEQLFWKQLSELIDQDNAEWPSEIPTDPNHNMWEFCFHGERYFVYCATPSHKNRNSRSFPTYMLAITPRWVFQQFKESKYAEKIIEKVRRRIEKYDSVPIHPELKTYGENNNYEWKQYFLRDDNQSLSKCPFHFKQ
ncbi:YqcI/YcgG family protein [Gracilibacillus sp. S3-1-1]|uniref:YqcI/YcgG family protein n=1 Tax=Gracilibacillus pellucidus TaxID=3095368 RepID=A0ACC6M2N2_9BACI|nr:YqcI/YcgG family protein [Gracilibacillus sp. S3-1-1]MDX8045184.1 YqcI/YcgG family protein [Gracilibacillus sp. S3-1-1]